MNDTHVRVTDLSDLSGASLRRLASLAGFALISGMDASPVRLHVVGDTRRCACGSVFLPARAGHKLCGACAEAAGCRG